jgi:glycosyltransferase involved in cell wall biosynthesis
MQYAPMHHITNVQEPQAQGSAANKPLRIAFVSETYPPEVNGVAITVKRFVEGLAMLGHAIQLIRPRQSAADSALPCENLEQVLVAGLPIPGYAGLKMGLPAFRKLVALWKRQRPDLVHIVTEGPLGWSALRAARKLKLPVSSDFRTNFHAYTCHYRLGWLQKPMLSYLRSFHNKTSLTLVPTEALRKQLTVEGFASLQVVARGVDTALFNPGKRSSALRGSWGAEHDTPVVVYVGRLAPEKNLGALLAAFDAVRTAAPAAKLVLVGDGPARSDIQARCPEAVFAGLRKGEDLAAHYASGDIFVFPSVTETFGNVTLEAMASGLAVLAYDYAAAGQLIESGRNGMLAPFGDSTALVKLAAGLASGPQAARLMGVHARQTAVELGWEAVICQFEFMLLHTARGSVQSTDIAQERLPDQEAESASYRCA